MNDRKDGGNDGGGNLCDRNKKKFLDTQVSLAPTPVRPSVRPKVIYILSASVRPHKASRPHCGG